MLELNTITIDDMMYRVSENNGNFRNLKKSKAYIVQMLNGKIVLPYHGKLDDFKRRGEELKPGLYICKNSYIPYPIYPTKKDRHKYTLDKIQDITNKDVLENTDFIKSDIDLTIEGDIMVLPKHDDDDILNRVFKAALTAKRICFEQYGKRLTETDAGTKPDSRKSNAKKALQNNTRLTPTKLEQYGNAFDLRFAVVITDDVNSIHPMITSPLVVYSNGKFDLSNAVELSEVSSMIYDISTKKKDEDTDDEEEEGDMNDVSI